MYCARKFVIFLHSRKSGIHNAVACTSRDSSLRRSICSVISRIVMSSTVRVALCYTRDESKPYNYFIASKIGKVCNTFIFSVLFRCVSFPSCFVCAFFITFFSRVNFDYKQYNLVSCSCYSFLICLFFFFLTRVFFFLV